jgi:hypothetical protein
VRVKQRARYNHKMMIPCENTTKNRQPYYNGSPTIPVKSGSIKNSPPPTHNFMRIQQTCQFGELFLKIYSGRGLKKLLKIHDSS